MLEKQQHAPTVFDSDAFLNMLLQQKKIINIPTRTPLSQTEVQERERRAQLMGHGKAGAEIVAEDRGE